jgi:enamine deaminase RidA (YjgF/YER057c/UK114 family)
MNNIKIEIFESEKVISKISSFHPKSGTNEAHLLIQSQPKWDTLQSWAFIQNELERIKIELGYHDEQCLFMRVFCSDALNQEKILRENYPFLFNPSNRPNLSFVQQPVLPASKLAVWAYLVKGKISVERTEYGNLYHSNGLTHIWTANLMASESSGTFYQTEQMFLKYLNLLSHFSSNLYNNALRTWIFVRDIDTIYADLVKARKLIFEEQGLNKQTHYITSTGIEGKNEIPNQFAFMDAYSIVGVDPKQIKYLHAPSHMCPTANYGVTFERGTTISYGDRQHVFISGTASINNQGEILHSEDVDKQTERVIENISVLLSEAGCNLSNITYAVVYIRDNSDYYRVNLRLKELIPEIPAIILLASVCRPGWLVEIEVMAISQQRSSWANF